MSTDRDRARWALREDRTLSRIAKLVWYSLDSRGEDPYPSIRTLAADCGRGVGRNLVKAGISELADGNWLRVECRMTDFGDSDTNRYVLMCPAQAGWVRYRPTPQNRTIATRVGPSQTHGWVRQSPPIRRPTSRPTGRPTLKGALRALPVLGFLSTYR
jgi:hypothetical protein